VSLYAILSWMCVRSISSLDPLNTSELRDRTRPRIRSPQKPSRTPRTTRSSGEHRNNGRGDRGSGNNGRGFSISTDARAEPDWIKPNRVETLAHTHSLTSSGPEGAWEAQQHREHDRHRR